MRAIKIDPVAKTITEIELARNPNETLKELYNLIGCDLVELVQIDRDMDLICDEEGKLKAVIQGFQYRDMLESGKVATVSELAAKVKQERAFLFRALSLVNLAPDIIEAILNGKEPAKLTLSKLRKGFPEDWTEQRKMFEAR